MEKMRAIGVFDRNPTSLARRISQSSKRPSAESAIEQEFQRVRKRFENSKGNLREHWYVGTLRDLAAAVGFESEYELLQKQLSGAVHASPFALKEGSYYRGFLLADLAWRFSFRVLGSFAEYAQITLDISESELVSLAAPNIFEAN